MNLDLLACSMLTGQRPRRACALACLGPHFSLKSHRRDEGKAKVGRWIGLCPPDPFARKKNKTPGESSTTLLWFEDRGQTTIAGRIIQEN